MAMSIGAGTEGPIAEMNTTPLIDVLLVLLIMLIITLPAMTHAIKLNTPMSGEGAIQKAPVKVLIDFDGTIVWNGTLVPTLAELEQRFQQESRVLPQPVLEVHADRRAKYDTVARVLALAQRSGMKDIAIGQAR